MWPSLHSHAELASYQLTRSQFSINYTASMGLMLSAFRLFSLTITEMLMKMILLEQPKFDNHISYMYNIIITEGSLEEFKI